MSIETTHHEIKVGYNTDTDEWTCHAMDLKAKTLSLLKKKMDKVLNVERRIDNLPVLMIGSGYGMTGMTGMTGKITTGVATMFDSKGGYGGPQVWVNVINGNQTERRKVNQSSVWIDTPENRERLQAIAAAYLEARAMDKRINEMVKEAGAFTLTPLEVTSLKTVEQVAYVPD